MMFANKARLLEQAMPGVISGIGGGTWNADGSPATPDQAGAMNPLAGSAAERFPTTGAVLPSSYAIPAMRGKLPNTAQPVSMTATQPVLTTAETQPNQFAVDGLDTMPRPTLPVPSTPVPGMFGNRGGLPARTGLPLSAGGPLGGSMRQPFDYEAARKQLAGPQKKMRDWAWILAGLGDVASTLGGGQANGLRNLMARRDGMRSRARAADEQILKWQHDEWQRQNEADLRAAAPYTIGRDRLAFDPATGQTAVQYRGPQDSELYAEQLGLEPGTQEYFDAVEDYVLKSNGPSAYDRNVALDDRRTANDARLEGIRYDNRINLEGVRQGNRRGMVDYRNANPAPARSRAPAARSGSPRERLPEVSSPAEARKLPSGTRFRIKGTRQVKVVP